MKIEKVSINEIKPYIHNSKEHPSWHIEQIKKSIEQFGFNDPIAVDENNVIIEGHGRFEALKQLGKKEVECIRLDHMNEEKKKAYILAHNKLTMNTDFDTDKLLDELDEIINIDMEDFGFAIEEDEDINEVVDGEIEIENGMFWESNYVVIHTEDEFEWKNLQAMFNLRAKSTQNGHGVGISRVVTFKEFEKAIKDNGKV